ncbi:hypothetical protein C8R44DRAFT_849317 [Mycena epipterygia]|nr:hypothetical protein C8R44DRAFT_849317 [Mycena epipterygia]
MSSPFAARLGTNYCPKDEEIADIKALIVEPTLRLKRLDDDIADMQKAINKLTAERDALVAYVDSHKALISPARQLPVDIIQEIFMACIPTHRNCVMSAGEAPVLLGRICSSWRTLSLLTPRLWARLHVVEPMRHYNATSALFKEKLAQRLETTKTWLERSGQCPLSISLESATEPFGGIPPPTDPPIRPTTDLFIQALLPFTPRWEHISFTTPPAALEKLVHLAETAFPLLKSVTLNQYPYGPPHSVTWGHLGMLRASQISSFSISAVTNFSLTELPLRWDQLTSLSITSQWNAPTSHAILPAISRCPALQSCKLTVFDSPNPETQPLLDHPIVQLAYLHTLELCCAGSAPSTFALLFPRISLPSLRRFFLLGSPHEYGPDGLIAELDSVSQVSLSRFIAGSTCLESVGIDNMFPKSSLIQIIQSLPPTLKRLRIKDTPVSSLDDDVLAVLTPGPGLPPFSCPALQELVINHACSISDTAVLQFITARMAVQPVTTLNVVEILFGTVMQRDILPSLQTFIDTGLKVSITYPLSFPPRFSPWQGLADAPGSMCETAQRMLHRSSAMSSPFAARLGTNFCPKDKEITEIKALIVEPTLRLKRLDDEITDMQKAIDKLIAERDSLGAYVEGHKALLSPARQLPVDIIQEIFTACIPTHRNCVMSASEAPVLLGRICSSWRTLSLSTPRLWARLHVVEPVRLYNVTSTLFEEKLAQRLETTRNWLERSGQCPLSISLESGPESGPEAFGVQSPTDLATRPAIADLFLQVLIPFASRWEHISFTTPPAALDTLVHPAGAAFPLLKSVSLNQHPYGVPNSVKWGRLGMLRASQISSFSISAAASGLSLTELPLRWDQLTSLSIASPAFTSHAILQAISRCPALRYCKLLVFDSPSLETQPPRPIIEFAFLHTLELSCGGSAPSTFTLLLPWISLSGLRNFDLHGSPHGYGPDGQIAELDSVSQASLSHFFAALTCLESLGIDNMFSKSSLIRIIQGLPSTLKRLRIQDTHGSSLDDDVLAVLTPFPGLPPLFCPALQELIINHAYSISDTAVLQFITARMAVEPVTTLKLVKILFSTVMQRDILPSLQTFIDAGLKVSITYPPSFPPRFSPWQGLADAPGQSHPFPLNPWG